MYHQQVRIGMVYYLGSTPVRVLSKRTTSKGLRYYAKETLSLKYRQCSAKDLSKDPPPCKSDGLVQLTGILSVIKGMTDEA